MSEQTKAPDEGIQYPASSAFATRCRPRSSPPRNSMKSVANKTCVNSVAAFAGMTPGFVTPAEGGGPEKPPRRSRVAERAWLKHRQRAGTGSEREGGVDPGEFGFAQSEISGSLSSACLAFAALGMAKSDGRRTRKASAAWRGVAPCASAISCSTRPPAVSGPGNPPS